MVDHFKVLVGKKNTINSRFNLEVSYLQVGVSYPLVVNISINPYVMTRDMILNVLTDWYKRAGIDVTGDIFKRALIHLKGCITKAINDNR